ncbi:PEGA domain-containing protein [Patescibacteria group bacterium]|nr:PEGA domain-containing protein [Patescibacteria group bacterium]
MKKILFFVLPVLASILVFLLILFLIDKSNSKGALQVTSIPKSKVFLDGKPIGETPLCKCEEDQMLKVGNYTVRLVPNDSKVSPYEQKISISPSVLTVVDRSFGQGALSEGSVIKLSPISEKEAQLLIISFPEKAEVLLDNEIVGITPLLLKKITESDHEIKLRKSGYREKSLRIRPVKSYKLEALIYLSINPKLEDKSIIPSISPTPTSEEKIEILNTPTGFLRVRAENSISSSEITQVKPGESYAFISEEKGWYQIKLPDDKTGWISSQYAKKLTEEVKDKDN